MIERSRAASTVRPLADVDDGRLRLDAVPTWGLFLAIAAAFTIANWYSQTFVVTRDVQAVLLRSHMDAAAFEGYWQRLRRARILSYLLEPALLWCQVAFTALLAQLFFLGIQQEVRFGRLFRAGVLAHVVVLVEVTAQLVHRSGLSLAEISTGAFYRPVGALAALGPSSVSWPDPVRSILLIVTVFELLWVAAFVIALRRNAEVSSRNALLAASTVFVSLNLLEYSVRVLVASLVA